MYIHLCMFIFEAKDPYYLQASGKLFVQFYYAIML